MVFPLAVGSSHFFTLVTYFKQLVSNNKDAHTAGTAKTQK